MNFAYTRISTNKKTQKHDRQQLSIQTYANENGFTIDKWINETISGTVSAENRPLYNDMYNHFTRGDTLIITDIDRIGRNADDVISELKRLKSMGIRVVALDVPYMNDWGNSNNDSLYNMIIDIVITLKAHMAQQEREKTVNRINQGLAAAKEKGHTLGRPRSDIPCSFIKEYNKFQNGEYGEMSISKFSKMLGIGRSTVYKYIQKINSTITV
ncbi:recombinase family protein [Lachnospiraceae bacterium MD329]|jgi:DNA invertase Pin-like site-specific DNA recombinase|nr:recombinase family protein [Lachnospiraceae bacterium MD329]